MAAPAQCGGRQTPQVRFSSSCAGIRCESAGTLLARQPWGLRQQHTLVYASKFLGVRSNVLAIRTFVYVHLFVLRQAVLSKE